MQLHNQKSNQWTEADYQWISTPTRFRHIPIEVTIPGPKTSQPPHHKTEPWKPYVKSLMQWSVQGWRTYSSRPCWKNTILRVQQGRFITTCMSKCKYNVILFLEVKYRATLISCPFPDTQPVDLPYVKGRAGEASDSIPTAPPPPIQKSRTIISLISRRKKKSKIKHFMNYLTKWHKIPT